jgi:hypothetical protein
MRSTASIAIRPKSYKRFAKPRVYSCQRLIFYQTSANATQVSGTVSETYQHILVGPMVFAFSRYNTPVKALAMTQRLRILVALAAMTIVGATPCAGVTRAPGERIISFATDITVREDTSIEVREEFTVHSEGTYFKWGMIRHLPISSNERWDKRFAGEWKDDTGIRVKILEVTEDGERVWYEQGSGWGYGQLRIGNVDVPLARGDHTFVIKYMADGVLRPLADHDELYWNDLGYYFELPVEDATVRVRLPAGVPQDEIQPEAYVGGRGVSNPRKPETELTREESPDAVSYRATNFGPSQSLSLALSWPKGFVTPPKMGVFARHSWLLAAPAVFFLYYLIVWIRLGPEPALGSVPVRYDPPEELSPAAVRYIRTTGSDARTLAAVIAQLAARECLGIDLQDGKYKLTQLKTDASVVVALAPEEARVLEMLFEDGKEIILHPNKGDELNRYSLAIQGQLQKRLDGVYFTRHGGYIAIGMLTSLMTAMWMALTAEGKDTSGVLFLTWWFFFCASILGAMVIFSVVPAWKLALRGLGGTRQLLIGMAVLAVFGAAFVMLLRMLANGVSPMYSVALAALVTVNLVWIPALKRMTARGREAVGEIEGFRTFLEKVEQDRMQRLNTTGETPNAAVEFLPYAIALEVKESWGDHLAEAFFATTTSR